MGECFINKESNSLLCRSASSARLRSLMSVSTMWQMGVPFSSVSDSVASCIHNRLPSGRTSRSSHDSGFPVSNGC